MQRLAVSFPARPAVRFRCNRTELGVAQRHDYDGSENKGAKNNIKVTYGDSARTRSATRRWHVVLAVCLTEPSGV